MQLHNLFFLGHNFLFLKQSVPLIKRRKNNFDHRNWKDDHRKVLFLLKSNSLEEEKLNSEFEAHKGLLNIIYWLLRKLLTLSEAARTCQQSNYVRVQAYVPVKFGTLYVPDSHPTPSFCFFWFWGFSLGLVIWSDLSFFAFEALASFCCCKHM